MSLSLSLLYRGSFFQWGRWAGPRPLVVATTFTSSPLSPSARTRSLLEGVGTFRRGVCHRHPPWAYCDSSQSQSSRSQMDLEGVAAITIPWVSAPIFLETNKRFYSKIEPFFFLSLFSILSAKRWLRFCSPGVSVLFIPCHRWAGAWDRLGCPRPWLRRGGHNTCGHQKPTHQHNLDQIIEHL